MLHDSERADQQRLLAALLATKPKWHRMSLATMAKLLAVSQTIDQPATAETLGNSLPKVVQIFDSRSPAAAGGAR